MLHINFSTVIILQTSIEKPLYKLSLIMQFNHITKAKYSIMIHLGKTISRIIFGEKK